MEKYVLIIMAILFISCSIEPKPIEYGTDSCHYCEMTIVDKLHAAEIVTNKGKVFKFDATECMINHLKEIDVNTVKLQLTTDYSKPKNLIDATKAFYLISKSLPSPMGANLTAFKSQEDALKMKQEKNGELYTWEELLAKLNK